MKSTHRFLSTLIVAVALLSASSMASAQSRTIKNTFVYVPFTKSGKVCRAPGAPGQPSKAECSGHLPRIVTGGELVLRDDSQGMCMRAVVHGVRPAQLPSDHGKPHVIVAPVQYQCDFAGNPRPALQFAARTVAIAK